MDSRPGRRTGSPRTVLEGLIWQSERTYDELAADFETLATSRGERAAISARHLRRLAAGQRQGTTPVTRRVLQVMFGRPLESLLGSVGDPPGPFVTAALRSITGDSALDHQENLAMAAQRARRFAHLIGQSSLSSEAVDHLTEDVHDLARAYPQRPLTELLGDLILVQETLFTALEGRQPPVGARRLYVLAGLVGGLLAKASHDRADPHASLAHARTAYLCAQNAEFPALQAWLRGLQSLVSYWAGRPADSLRYAQSGVALAGGEPSGTTSVWLASSEARAWATLGDADSAARAIRHAEDLRERVRPDDLDDIGGICTFGVARQTYYAADAMAWFPDQSALTLRYAEQAVAAYSDVTAPEWAFGDQAGAHTDLAIARIVAGQVDGAGPALAGVLDLPVEKRMYGIVASVQRVAGALRTAPQSAAASALQERIEPFLRSPLQAVTA